MKLLFFTEHFRLAGSGLENDCVNLLTALAARGHDVHVCCHTAKGVPTVTAHLTPTRPEDVIASLHPDVTVDWNLLREADIHRLGGGAHAEYLRLRAGAYRGPAGLYKRLEQYLPRHRRVIRRERRLLANPGALFLPNSAFCADQLIAEGADPARVRVLPNGFDLERFRPPTPEEKAAARRRFGVDGAACVFLFVAHNLRLKNMALLRRVFRRIRAERDDAILLVVGRRKPFAAGPAVRHIGLQSDMPGVYAAADCLLHPTFYDSCANVVPEALACGLHVCSSDVNGSADLIREGVTGRVLPVHTDDADDLWAAAVREAIAETARPRASERPARSADILPYARFVTLFEEALTETAERKRGVPLPSGQ